jgi:hypothetical protein
MRIITYLATQRQQEDDRKRGFEPFFRAPARFLVTF